MTSPIAAGNGVFVIVQARMTSTRLPGKVLLNLNGKSVLAHCLDRCHSIPGISGICVATVDTPDCDAVAQEAERNNAIVFRGSEGDVLDRYWRAARELSAKTVIRVTSDCPLIDPEVCGAVLSLFQKTGAEYATNNAPPSFPHGLDVEVMSFECLEHAAQNARLQPDREHVTPYIRRGGDHLRVNLGLSASSEVGKHRWTLDTPDDLRFFEALFARLGPQTDKLGYEAVLEFVSEHEDLAYLNKGSADHLRSRAEYPNFQQYQFPGGDG